MHRKSEEKDAFYAELMIHLTVQSMGGHLHRRVHLMVDTLSDIHKDAWEGVCEVPLKGAPEIALELHLVVALVEAEINAQMCTKKFI